MNIAQVAEALTDVIDPELGIDIVSLGLLYSIEMDDHSFHVKMTMTTPGCPMATAITQMTAGRLKVLSPEREVHLQVVEDPPWNIGMLNESARRRLGIR